MIVFEGGIGAGKSTIADLVAKYLKRTYDMIVSVYHEPVKKNPYLEKYYADRARWALEMQYFLMAYRFRMHRDAVDEEWAKGIVTLHDRSIYGDGAFAYVNYRDGYIDQLGYDSYMAHRECMERYLLVPHLVIYLDVCVDRLQERIRERDRVCESGIPDSYLADLDAAYKEIVLPKLQDRGARVVILDWNKKELEIERVMEVINDSGAAKIRHCGLGG